MSAACIVRHLQVSLLVQNNIFRRWCHRRTHFRQFRNHYEQQRYHTVHEINNCTEFEACSFSRCEDTARKHEYVQFGENVKNCCQATPTPLNGFLYSCCCMVWQLSARAVLTPCFDMLPFRCGVGVCRDRVGQKSKFWDIFTPPHPDILQISAITVLCCVTRPRGICVKSLRAIGCDGLGKWPIN